MTPQELITSLTSSMGALIKAEIRTAEVTIKANTEAAIKATEERLIERLKAVEQKLDKLAADHEERLEGLEDYTGIHRN